MSEAPGWPARLESHGVVVRSLRRSDAEEWQRARARNQDWLRPWDATVPPGAPPRPTSYKLVTKSLLFAGEGAGMFVASEGGTKFRAHDKRTGDIVWETDLGLRQTGVPMTYAAGGKQYILVPAGAPGQAGEFIALALSD